MVNCATERQGSVVLHGLGTAGGYFAEALADSRARILRMNLACQVAAA